jgi:sialate O-acetylesterase
VTSGTYKQSLEVEWKMNIGKVNSLWIRSPCAHPNLTYNGMIHPILQYPIKGVIWYQGENNVLFAYQYRETLKAMIQDWRSKFISKELPFYLVQLPNMSTTNNDSQHGGSDWAELRESQNTALSLSKVGMIVTIDLGDSTNIHPKDKTEVGRRLALQALSGTYGKELGEVSSPIFKSVNYEGNKAILTFDHVGTGLIARNRYGYLNGFEVAGLDKKFHWVKATISGNQVIIDSSNVANPVAIRYAWSNNPYDSNLFNREGFPASPFRTDNWEAVTQNEKYSNWIK